MKNISNAHPNSANINMLKIILYTLHNALMCQNKDKYRLCTVRFPIKLVSGLTLKLS